MKKWMLPLLVGLMLLLTACGENQDALLPAAGDAQSAGGEKEVWQLSIVQPPEKLDYEEGETFDPTGVVIQAQLRDGSVLGDVPYKRTKFCRATYSHPFTQTKANHFP